MLPAQGKMQPRKLLHAPCLVTTVHPGLESRCRTSCQALTDARVKKPEKGEPSQTPCLAGQPGTTQPKAVSQNACSCSRQLKEAQGRGKQCQQATEQLLSPVAPCKAYRQRICVRAPPSTPSPASSPASSPSSYKCNFSPSFSLRCSPGFGPSCSPKRCTPADGSSHRATATRSRC